MYYHYQQAPSAVVDHVDVQAKNCCQSPDAAIPIYPHVPADNTGFHVEPPSKD